MLYVKKQQFFSIIAKEAVLSICMQLTGWAKQLFTSDADRNSQQIFPGSRFKFLKLAIVPISEWSLNQSSDITPIPDQGTSRDCWWDVGIYMPPADSAGAAAIIKAGINELKGLRSNRQWNSNNAACIGFSYSTPKPLIVSAKTESHCSASHRNQTKLTSVSVSVPKPEPIFGRPVGRTFDIVVDVTVELVSMCIF